MNKSQLMEKEHRMLDEEERQELTREEPDLMTLYQIAAEREALRMQAEKQHIHARVT